MKKTTKLFLSIGCLTALTIVSQAQPILVPNGDFEMNTAKTPFFDSTGAIIVDAVPYWKPSGPGLGGGWNFPDGPGTGNSGVDMGSGDAPTMHMYLNQGDPSAYDTTGTGLVVGDIYKATFVLGGEWNNYGGMPYTTTVDIYADDGLGDRITLSSTPIVVPFDYTERSYSVWAYNPSFEGSDGWTIGVSFQNTTQPPPHTEGWSVVDDVTLQYDVPEPSTIALLTLGGLGALVGIRRRHA